MQPNGIINAGNTINNKNDNEIRFYFYSKPKYFSSHIQKFEMPVVQGLVVLVTVIFTFTTLLGK